MKIIGITGGIASGKSLISTWLAAQNYPVIDADQIARAVVQKGEKALQEICNAFGSWVLQPNGELNRKRLGDVIFSNEKERIRLNQIIHPYIHQRINDQLNAYRDQGKPLVFVDIPLLYENKLESMFDQVIVIDVNRDVQIKRLMARDHLTQAEAAARIDIGIPLADKKARADFVIDNNGTHDEAFRQFCVILKGM